MLSQKLSHLILASRSKARGEEAAAPLRKAFPKAKIEVWHLDMNSYDSIKQFARDCSQLPRLDIAILGAGIMNVAFETNRETGHEEMFQVNYLSTALLSLLILPILKTNKSGDSPGHLVQVASGAALIAEYVQRNEEPLMPSFDKKEGWNATIAKKRYDDTKGMVLMLTHQLSTIVDADDTIVNVVDPTFTPGTGFFRKMPVLVRALTWPLTRLLGTTVNNAAWRYFDAAVARGKESHGSFISDWEISPYVHCFP
jgi:NAD(P)-dependent dehydrogenase (short-subunit alcohol dehydrogenase family)